MQADLTWLVLSLICGLICAIVAHTKGRVAIWWFLIGVVLTIPALFFVALASDLKRISSLEDEVDRLRQELHQEVHPKLRELRFDQAVTLGEHQSESICGSCDHFTETFSVCGAFRREITLPVVVCREFVLELDDEETDQGREPLSPPPPPSISPSPARW